MAFDIGGGLSALGGAVAQTAGTAALDLQKADLESRRDILANQLAADRETKLEEMRQTGSLALAAKQSQLRVGEVKQEDIDKADLALAQAPKLAAANAAIAKQNASDPAYLKSLRLISDASATVSERAAAAASMQQVVGLKLQNAAEKEVADSRAALKAATIAGDEAAIQAAERRMSVATYSAKDEVQAAATLKGVADSARLYVESLETRAARIAASSQANTPAAKAQLAQINGEISAANENYNSLQAQAVDAAKKIPQINVGTGNTVSANAPSLSAILGGKPSGMGMPSLGVGAQSLINSPNLTTIGGQ